MSKAALEEWLGARYDEDRYYLPSLRPVSEHVHVGENSGSVEWYTPPEFIAAARAVLGTIDLDPASSEVANSVVMAAEYFDERADGLSQEWNGNVWMNPPYSLGLVDEFMAKLCKEIDAKRVTSAITLTNNATDTGWFASVTPYSEAMCTVKGRVKYLDYNLEPAGSPLQGQVVLYFGKSVKRFVKCFRELGTVWVKT